MCAAARFPPSHLLTRAPAGPWRLLFDRYANDRAHIVGRLTDVDICDHFGWKDRCRMAGGERCFSGPARQPCLLCKTSWPVLRLSRHLAMRIKSTLEAGATGHHEAFVGAVCARQPAICSRVSFPSSLAPAFALGGEPNFRPTANGVASSKFRYFQTVPGLLHAFNRSSVQLNSIYHPVKCQADDRAGPLQESWALHGKLPKHLASVPSETLSQMLDAVLMRRAPPVVTPVKATNSTSTMFGRRKKAAALIKPPLNLVPLSPKAKYEKGAVALWTGAVREAGG